MNTPELFTNTRLKLFWNGSGLTENLQVGPALSIARCKSVDLAEEVPFVRELDVHDGQRLAAVATCDADAVRVSRVLVYLLHGEVTKGDPHSSPSRPTLRFKKVNFRKEASLDLVLPGSC